jgi:hypothetical protein
MKKMLENKGFKNKKQRQSILKHRQREKKCKKEKKRMQSRIMVPRLNLFSQRFTKKTTIFEGLCLFDLKISLEQKKKRFFC